MKFVNSVITRQMVIFQINKVLSNIPINAHTLNIIRENVNADSIYSLFENLKSPEQIDNLTLTSNELLSLEDYVNFVTIKVKLDLATAYTQAGMIAGIVDENMSLEEQINLLIDLKNVDQISLLQEIVAKYLEGKF